MWVAFAMQKLFTFFSANNINVFAIFQNRTFNVTLAYNLVKFWTTEPRWFANSVDPDLTQPSVAFDLYLKKMMMMMIWCFMSLSLSFQSYWDNGRVIMKGFVLWSTKPSLNCSKPGPHEPMSGVLTTRLCECFWSGSTLLRTVCPNTYEGKCHICFWLNILSLIK